MMLVMSYPPVFSRIRFHEALNRVLRLARCGSGLGVPGSDVLALGFRVCGLGFRGEGFLNPKPLNPKL